MEDESSRTREYSDIMEDLETLHAAYREKIRAGFSEPEGSMKLSEIEKLHRELNLEARKLSLEETDALLTEIDEAMLISKKKESTVT